MKRLPLSTILLLLISATGAFSQAKAITETQFNDGYRNALEAAVPLPRKVTTESSNFVAVGTDTSTVVRFEDGDGGARVVMDRTRSGATEHTEIVQLGGDVYRKAGTGPWQLNPPGLIFLPDDMVPSHISSAKYTTEKVTLDGDAYDQYHAYKLFKDPNAGKGSASFWDFTVWVDKAGRITRELTKSGPVNGKTLSWTTEINYIYDPKIKVEAPTVGGAAK